MRMNTHIIKPVFVSFNKMHMKCIFMYCRHFILNENGRYTAHFPLLTVSIDLTEQCLKRRHSGFS